jgi:tyrosine-protein kinase Etk/Wzc
MNIPNASPPAAQPSNMAMDDEDSINLLDLLDVVMDQKKLIGSVAAAFAIIGGGYAFTATPIYEADTLIQVENSSGNSLGLLLGEAGSLFDTKSASSAEIEILRSRLVVGQAVSNLQLDMTITPKYVPVLGEWMARGKTEPSEPGFMGMSGYVRGNESIRIGSFGLDPSQEGQRFSIVLTDKGYNLLAPDGKSLGQGQFEKPLKFNHLGRPGTLLVVSAVGKPGAEFYISRRSHLAVTEQLQSQLKIAEQGKQSGVLRTSLEGADPEQITKILNEVGALYVRQNTERKSAEAEKSLAFLNTQLPQLKKQLEASEAKFNRFRVEKGTFDLNSEAQTYLQESVDLKVKLLELQTKRTELAVRFTAQHPSMQAVDSSIRDLQSRLRAMESKAKTLPGIEQDLLRLTRDVKVDNELYTNLLNSFQQLRLVKEGKVGNVRIVDVAIEPEQAVKPRRSLILALFAALGLLAGLFLAFVRNSLRQGVKSAEELESRLGLHVFATIPHSANQAQLDADARGKKPGTHLLAILKSNDAAVESLRSLRTALQFAMLDVSNNVVLITGPTPNIGKSFTCANFAAVLAAAGKRVVLIDADMRKGHMHQFFGLERGQGLSDLIAGTQTLPNVLRANIAPGLDFMSAGTIPPNPAELLMSSGVQDLLKTLSSQYDIVLVDTPPVLAVSDSAILAPLAGTTFIVVRADISTLGEVQESTKRLQQSGVNVKGVIFNGLDISKRRYGYGYGYGYGYKYKRYGYRYQAYNYTKDN